MPDIMGKMDIAFPHLGIYLHNVPKTITIGNFTIAMYGIVMAISMLCGILMAAHMAKRTGQDPNLYWDVSIWLIIFALIGARLYYVIFFWEQGGYAEHPLQIFNLRQGGLAVYGSIIGGIITLIVYCRIKKKKLLRMMDTAAYGMIIGQIIGRWANFFNREVFGQYTDSLFAMRLPVEMVRERDIDETIAAHMSSSVNYIQVHPTFLYESVLNIGVLILMLIQARKKRYDGRITLTYFAGYGIVRGCIEYIRTDQLYIPHTTIPVNLVVGFIVAVIAIIVMIVCDRFAKAGKISVTDFRAAAEAYAASAAKESVKAAQEENAEATPQTDLGAEPETDTAAKTDPIEEPATDKEPENRAD